MPSIADHIRDLGKDGDLPVAALEACVERIDEAKPPLRALLRRAARGKPFSDDDAARFFFGLHVLAAARDTDSFQPMLQLLRQPDEIVDDLLGDAVTVTLPKIAASVFDGDAEALFGAIIDPRIDEYARDSLFGAATFLTWDGRIALDRMRDFLTRFEVDRAAPDGAMPWVGWVTAVGLLGLRDMLPAAERVFAANRLPDNVMEWRHLEQDLRDAESAPNDIGRFETADLGYLGDVIEALRWTQAQEDAAETDDWPAPVVNPYRDVGRNDPCPCGSGKKFKKCCLAAADMA